MNILSLSKEQVIAFAESGMMNKASPLHWDVCNAICRGDDMNQVANKFNTSIENIKWIKKAKCKGCR